MICNLWSQTGGPISPMAVYLWALTRSLMEALRQRRETATNQTHVQTGLMQSSSVQVSVRISCRERQEKTRGSARGQTSNYQNTGPWQIEVRGEAGPRIPANRSRGPYRARYRPVEKGPSTSWVNIGDSAQTLTILSHDVH